jgi:hypothetical protein
LKGTYSCGVDQGKPRGRGIFIAEGEDAEWQFEGEWEDNLLLEVK